MTFLKLKEILEKYDVPEDVLLLSDSGWECSATDMDAIYYNSKLNRIVFTQEGNVGHTDYDFDLDWELLYG